MTEYSSNNLLNSMIEKAVTEIDNKDFSGLDKVIKKTLTGILAADDMHFQQRFRPRQKLTTYTKMEGDEPVKETWGGGVAGVGGDSVILMNMEPIKYSEGHEREGEVVVVSFNSDNEFVVDHKNGSEILRNEYISNPSFVEGAYKKTADVQLQTGFKLVPSYRLFVPEHMEDVDVVTKSDVVIHLNGGDSVVFDYDKKKEKITSIHGVEKDWAKKTYMGFAEYENSL